MYSIIIDCGFKYSLFSIIFQSLRMLIHPSGPKTILFFSFIILTSISGRVDKASAIDRGGVLEDVLGLEDVLEDTF